MNLPKLVAFTGLSQCGKDTAARALLDMGYVRHNFGDIIKSQLDPLVQKYFGFSAFTEVAENKAKIRRTLESWGEDNYDAILAEFLYSIPTLCVNTRLCRAKEGYAWRERGGVLIEIIRGNHKPTTPWEVEKMQELYQVKLIDGVLGNNGTPEDLHKDLLSLLSCLGRRQ